MESNIVFSCVICIHCHRDLSPRYTGTGDDGSPFNVRLKEIRCSSCLFRRIRCQSSKWSRKDTKLAEVWMIFSSLTLLIHQILSTSIILCMMQGDISKACEALCSEWCSSSSCKWIHGETSWMCFDSRNREYCLWLFWRWEGGSGSWWWARFGWLGQVIFCASSLFHIWFESFNISCCDEWELLCTVVMELLLKHWHLLLELMMAEVLTQCLQILSWNHSLFLPQMNSLGISHSWKPCN